MVKKVFLLALTLIMTSSCASGSGGFLKKSANGKYFDNKGFHGAKRQPLYNPKYIKLAKRNVSNNYLSEEAYEEYEEEKENPIRDNIKQYIKLIKAEEELKDRERRSNDKKIYPSLIKANARIDPNTHANNLKLKEELYETRKMLRKTQTELKKQNELLIQKKKYEAAQEKKAKMTDEMKKKPMQKEMHKKPKKKVQKHTQKTEIKNKVDHNNDVRPLPSAAKSTEIIEPKKKIKSL